MCIAPVYDTCEACQGEGRIMHVHGYRWDDGDPYGWEESCPYCDGTGAMEVESYPVELEDLVPLIPQEAA